MYPAPPVTRTLMGINTGTGFCSVIVSTMRAILNECHIKSVAYQTNCLFDELPLPRLAMKHSRAELAPRHANGGKENVPETSGTFFFFADNCVERTAPASVRKRGKQRRVHQGLKFLVVAFEMH